jgi:hypothetical protein
MDELLKLKKMHQYAYHMSKSKRWAFIQDTILAALLLQRPVVVVRPYGISQNDLLRQNPQPNDQGLLRAADVYFPDGLSLVCF